MTRRLLTLLMVGLVAMVTAGCAGVPNSSAPQAIGTVERPQPKNLPKPTPGMDPDQLLREFLKATADPANRHLAARQFLTDSASNDWDDQGSALLIDKVVFVETRSPDRVSVTMKADILGSLSDIGVFETADGQLPDPGPIELMQTPDGWRISKLPNGVFLDWQQFQATYKRATLYFVDPTGKTVVPDPRYVAVSDPDQLATELVSKLIGGPRPEMAKTVRNLLGPPLKMIGPVTRADGGKTGIGRGYGGARIELENLTTTDPHSSATRCRTDHLDPGPRGHQGPVRHQRRRRRPRRPVRRRLEHHRPGGHRPGRGGRRLGRCARAARRRHGVAGRSAGDPGAGIVRRDGRPGGCGAVARPAATSPRW